MAGSRNIDLIKMVEDIFAPALQDATQELGEELERVRAKSKLIAKVQFTDEDIAKIVERVKAELYRKAKWELTEWKDEDSDGWGTQWAKCSICGNTTSSYHKAGAQDRFYDFCPKCGADMRGEE